MTRFLSMQPCVGVLAGVGMTQRSRDKLGIGVGEIVRVRSGENAIQRVVQKAPARAVAMETAEVMPGPFCIMCPKDWNFLELTIPDAPVDFQQLHVLVEKADEQIEMP